MNNIIFVFLYHVYSVYANTYNHTIYAKIDGVQKNYTIVNNKSNISLHDIKAYIIKTGLIHDTHIIHWSGLQIPYKIENSITFTPSVDKTIIFESTHGKKILLCYIYTEYDYPTCIGFDKSHFNNPHLKISEFRNTFKDMIQTNLPCIDWRFVKTVPSSESKNDIFMDQLVATAEENTKNISDIIHSNRIYIANFLFVNKIPISINVGRDDFLLYNITINPYMTTNILRQFLKGSLKCKNLKKIKTINEFNDSGLLLVNRKTLWNSNTHRLLKREYIIDPSIIVINPAQEDSLLVHDMLYENKYNANIIDYNNIYDHDAQFIGMSSDELCNPEKKICINLKKYNEHDNKLHPITLQYLKSITVSYKSSLMSDYFIAEDDTEFIITLTNKLYESGKYYEIVFKYHNGTRLVTYLQMTRPTIEMSRFTDGHRLKFKMLDNNIEDKYKRQLMQFEIVVTEYVKESKQKRDLENIRMKLKNTIPGTITKSSENDTLPHNILDINKLGYNKMVHEENIVFNVLIFKNREIAEKILHLVPKNTHNVMTIL